MAGRKNKKEQLVNFCQKNFWLGRGAKVLVAGCGDGAEAAAFADKDFLVTGVDLAADFKGQYLAVKNLCLQRADLQALPFEKALFDFIYCYHVLEHIANYPLALWELARVLKIKGWLFLGVPNRHRLLGYILPQSKTTLSQKILWNLKDWRFRFKGQFKNSFGAHAGFSSYELKSALDKIFPFVKEISLSYYSFLYPGWASLLKILSAFSFSEYLFPSLYFICRK